MLILDFTACHFLALKNIKIDAKRVLDRMSKQQNTRRMSPQAVSYNETHFRGLIWKLTIF